MGLGLVVGGAVGSGGLADDGVVGLAAGEVSWRIGIRINHRNHGRLILPIIHSLPPLLLRINPLLQQVLYLQLHLQLTPRMLLFLQSQLRPLLLQLQRQPIISQLRSLILLRQFTQMLPQKHQIITRVE